MGERPDDRPDTRRPVLVRRERDRSTGEPVTPTATGYQKYVFIELVYTY